MQIIFHNDDYGLNDAFTKGILLAHKKGLTTSTSIRTNGTDYERSVRQLKSAKNLGLGLHLNITDGSEYKDNFITYCLKFLKTNKKLEMFVKKDFDKQFEQVVKKEKLIIDHVNSQDHVHMIPTIFEITCKLCTKWNIPYIRIVNEPTFSINPRSIINGNLFKNLILKSFAKKNIKTAKRYKLKTADLFYGTLFTDNMSEDVIKKIITDAQKRHAKTIEILSHPTVKPNKQTKYTSEFLKKYTNKPNRVLELNALLSIKLRKFIKEGDITLTNFRALSHGK